MRLEPFTSADQDKVAPAFYKALKGWLDRVAQQLNQSTEGYIVSITNRQTSAPSSGSFQPGDFVKNSNRSELGAPGSKYILDGWECATSDPLKVLPCVFRNLAVEINVVPKTAIMREGADE